MIVAVAPDVIALDEIALDQTVLDERALDETALDSMAQDAMALSPLANGVAVEDAGDAGDLLLVNIDGTGDARVPRSPVAAESGPSVDAKPRVALFVPNAPKPKAATPMERNGGALRGLQATPVAPVALRPAFTVTEAHRPPRSGAQSVDGDADTINFAATPPVKSNLDEGVKEASLKHAFLNDAEAFDLATAHLSLPIPPDLRNLPNGPVVAPVGLVGPIDTPVGPTDNPVGPVVSLVGPVISPVGPVVGETADSETVSEAASVASSRKTRTLDDIFPDAPTSRASKGENKSGKKATRVTTANAKVTGPDPTEPKNPVTLAIKGAAASASVDSKRSRASGTRSETPKKTRSRSTRSKASRVSPAPEAQKTRSKSTPSKSTRSTSTRVSPAPDRPSQPKAPRTRSTLVIPETDDEDDGIIEAISRDHKASKNPAAFVMNPTGVLSANLERHLSALECQDPAAAAKEPRKKGAKVAKGAKGAKGATASLAGEAPPAGAPLGDGGPTDRIAASPGPSIGHARNPFLTDFTFLADHDDGETANVQKDLALHAETAAHLHDHEWPEPPSEPRKRSRSSEGGVGDAKRMRSAQSDSIKSNEWVSSSSRSLSPRSFQRSAPSSNTV